MTRARDGRDARAERGEARAVTAPPPPALGLYLHVPFCRTRCRYCDFYRVGEQAERMTQFLAALHRAIDGVVAWHGRAIDTVFFGGGTPSLLAPPEIGAILERVARRFALAADAEISLEANPSDLGPEKLAGLRTAGINRLSLGIQSFSDRELALLGRRHDAARAARVVAEARAAGFANLSLDLMLAIPGQTEASFRRSLERAVELAPDHLSLYLLEIHAGSEIDYLRRERPRLFPGEEAQRRRYLAVRVRLLAAGFEHYEISNFARPGHACRHNLKYWRCEPYLGLGPSAHSAVDGRRFRQPPALARFLADPLAFEDETCEPLAERVFLGLRLSAGVEERWLAEATGAPAEEIARRCTRLAPFVARQDGRVRLLPEGLVVSTPVIAELLAAAPAAAAVRDRNQWMIQRRT